MGIFHVYTAFFGVLTAFWQRSIHLTFGLLLCYFGVIMCSGSKREKIFSVFAVGAALLCLGHFIVNLQEMILRFGEPDTADLVTGTLIILLVLDFARRSVGNILPGIAVFFLLYAVSGPYLPGMLWHRGYDLTRIIYQISLSTEGIFGTPLGVSASYVFIFVLFGAFLEITGAGQFYIDFAVKAVGRSAGGPAKAAVVASSLFGSVSGSAVANVAGTGSVTIPLMRSIGYRPEFAAAVEAVASTGGQIMPPLMGAAAFIMAEILGIPYYKVATCTYFLRDRIHHGPLPGEGAQPHGGRERLSSSYEGAPQGKRSVFYPPPGPYLLHDNRPVLRYEGSSLLPSRNGPRGFFQKAYGTPGYHLRL